MSQVGVNAGRTIADAVRNPIGLVLVALLALSTGRMTMVTIRDRINDQAIAGLHQHLSVAGSPGEIIGQLAPYVAAISIHGHTLTTHHGLPPDLHDRPTP